MTNHGCTLEAKDYSVACSLMGKRTRVLLRSIVIASLVAFGVYWNTRPDQFSTMRLDLYQAALDAKLHGTRPLPADSRRGMLVWDIAQRHSEDQLHKRIDYLEQRQLNKLAFHAPVVNLDFEITDLAMIYGLTVLGLSAWLRLSILKELIVTRLAFTRARAAGYLKEFYERSSLLQTSLGSSLEERRSYWPWRAAQRVLIVLPILVDVLIAEDYYRSLAFTSTLLWSPPWVEIIISGISLCASVFFALRSVRDSTNIDRLWQEARNELGGHEVNEKSARYRKRRDHAKA